MEALVEVVAFQPTLWQKGVRIRTVLGQTASHLEQESTLLKVYCINFSQLHTYNEKYLYIFICCIKYFFICIY
jgi:hypothetical protein